MFKETNPTSSDKEEKPLAPNNVERKLSARDIALGIGRKATDRELDEYLDRPQGKSIPLREAIDQIKRKLAAKK